MSDLVERLRAPWTYTEGKREILCAEAATELTRLREQCKANDAEIERLKARDRSITLECSKENDAICQTLGKALGYPWFKDDQANFPGTTEENGVYVGDHVATSIASEAAKRLASLSAENERLRKALDDATSRARMNDSDGAHVTVDNYHLKEGRRLLKAIAAHVGEGEKDGLE